MTSARRVLLKENKRGRFDLKPTVERQESDVHQEMVDVEVSREEGNGYHIKTTGPLAQGEYEVLIRKQSAGGGYTGNVALKAARPQPASKAWDFRVEP